MSICRAGVLVCDDGTPPAGGVAPIAPAGAPFSDTGQAGSAINVTHGTWTGDAPISLSASGLPASVTFTDNSDGTYTLGGTYPAVAGNYSYTVAAGNASGVITTTGNGIEALAALSADVTFAPSLNNLGAPDPAVGTLAELLDVTESAALGGGANKLFHLVASNISGGAGPYSVDFSGLNWSITENLDPGPDRFTDVNSVISLNGGVIGTAAAGSLQSIPGDGGTFTVPAGSQIGGLTAASDYATLHIYPRVIEPFVFSTPPDVDEFPMTVSYQVTGNLVITDSLGATLTVPVLGSESFTIIPDSAGGSGGGPPPP